MLSFLRAVFRRAIADTAKSAAGYGLTLRAGMAFCLGSATHYSRFGGKAVIDGWQVWLSYVVLSAIGILAVEFVRHLACAPFRLERDRANDGERRIGLLQERVRTLEVERAAAIECAAEGFGLGPDWA